MTELLINLHMHTLYSDGEGTHKDIITAAQRAGIDVVIVTDHNTLVSGFEQYYTNGERKGLLLIGEEIHDQDRQPQKSHLLVFNSDRDLAKHASNPQLLIDQVKSSGGLSFLAHPVDPELKLFNEDDISWVDWDVNGFTGLELWNNFSEFKGRIKGRLSAIFLAFFPNFVAEQPFPAILDKWDSLLESGKKVVAIGGSDAHALHLHLGPIKKTVFPYELHFKSINNHVLTSGPLTGDLITDKKMIYEALGSGHSFIGYDLPAPTNGFQFTAQSEIQKVGIGEDLSFQQGATLQIRIPEIANVRLIKDGKIARAWNDTMFCTYITNDPGIYRVEVFIDYFGKSRAWIFSNPITLKKSVM